MNLRRLGAIVLKELRQLRRDRLTFAMIAGIPLLQLVLFGYAINMDVRGIQAAVLDQANTYSSREAIAELASSQVIDLRYHLDSPQQINQLLREGRISAALVIPADFDARLQRKDRPRCSWWSTAPTRACKPRPANWRPILCRAGAIDEPWRSSTSITRNA